jgi:hypothetical protein
LSQDNCPIVSEPRQTRLVLKYPKLLVMVTLYGTDYGRVSTEDNFFECQLHTVVMHIVVVDVLKIVVEMSTVLLGLG